MIIALLILAGLLAVGVLTEIACRLWIRFFAGEYVFPPYFHIEMDLDRNVLPRHTPHARFQVNSRGARADEPPASGKRTFRILACGGSGVECGSLDQPETWPGVVERCLNRPDNLELLGVEQVHVENIGKSGFTTEGLCYALPRVLPRHAPLDVLLIMSGASALNYWTKLGTPAQLPPPEPAWAEVAWHAQHQWKWTPRGSALAEVVRRLIQLIKKPVQVRQGVGKRLGKSRQMRKNAREVRTTFGDPTQWLDAYRTALEQAIRIGQAHARHVVLVRQPWFDKAEPSAEEAAMFWHGSVGDASVQAADVFYAHAALCAMMELVDEATVSVGAKLGIEVLQPAEVLEASARMFYDQFHVTTEGAAAVGEYVGQKLLEYQGHGIQSPQLSR